MRVAIGSDHAGYELKERLKKLLEAMSVDFVDVGTEGPEPVDYPDFAEKVAMLVAEDGFDRGIIVCGSGIGVCIAANKVPGIRAAACYDPECARLSREHNDANVLAIGARFVSPDQAEVIAATWLDTEFAGGRHARRVDKISRIEKRHAEKRVGGSR